MNQFSMKRVMSLVKLTKKAFGLLDKADGKSLL